MKTEEFNLSEKIFKSDEGIIEEEPYILLVDVKEFIKLFNEEMRKAILGLPCQSAGCHSIQELVYIFRKLTGEKLI